MCLLIFQLYGGVYQSPVRLNHYFYILVLNFRYKIIKKKKFNAGIY